MAIKQQIEQLVQDRQVRKARQLITRWLREDYSSSRIFEATQWYRRLSLYRDSLRLIMGQFPFDAIASREIEILVAETLSILGSTPYAIQIVEEIEPKTTEEFEVIAGIYFSANNYEKALDYFQKRIALAKDKLAYQIRLARLSCADCNANLGNFQQAISICRGLLKDSSETLFKSMCRQAMGEYLARSGNYKEAIRWLLDAKDSFPGKDETYDHALLYRWMGFTYVKLGNLSKGKGLLRRSTNIIKKTGLREEIWLENFKLAHDLGILSQNESRRLEFYPGLPHGFFTKKLYKSLELGEKKSALKIYFSSNEFLLKDASYLGIPMEIRLLGYLRIVESWGLSFELTKSLLWPNEGRSYLQLESRLRQMLKRIKRQYNIQCLVKNSRMYLDPKTQKKISVTIDEQSSLPLRLREEPIFTRDEITSWYNLKKTQATVWIDKLLSRGLIVKVNAGRSTKYRVPK